MDRHTSTDRTLDSPPEWSAEQSSAEGGSPEQPTPEQPSPEQPTPEQPPPGKPGPRLKQRPFWVELPILVVVALGLAVLIKTFLVQMFYIPSGSMEHTLQIDDRVLVNNLAYQLGEIERGDVIVFRGEHSWQSEIIVAEPTNAFDGFLRRAGEFVGFAPLGDKYFVKRVIGLPGDRVACCDEQGRVTVNGTPLNEQSYLYPGNVPSRRTFEATVPRERLWVMGDHRARSYDSRGHLGSPGGGSIAVDDVVGRAFVVVWPVSHWSLLDEGPLLVGE